MNVGSINFSGSINTSFQKDSLQQAAGVTPFSKPFSSTFAVDGSNPYFRIFAGSCGDISNAFLTTFTFTRGGALCGTNYSIEWGVDSVYNAVPGGSLNVTPFLGNDTIVVHSPFAGICNVIDGTGGGGGDAPGFICRWTALADKLIVTTAPVGIVTALSFNSEYFHGVIQQPF